MQFIATLKKKFNDTKEWCVDHKNLLIKDGAILLTCAGAIGAAVVISKNDDKKAAESQQYIVDVEIEPEDGESIETTTDSDDEDSSTAHNDELVDDTTNEEVNA